MDTHLRKYRIKKRLTQRALCALVNMSERAYNAHEKGKGGSCRDVKRENIALHLGVKQSVLFDKEGRAK